MLTPKETGSGGGFAYPIRLEHSALCEAGFSSTGEPAVNVTIALGWKPTAVNVGKPLCDPTHHYLLTIRKEGDAVSVLKQGVELGGYATSAATYAELVSEALTAYAGTTAGYYSRLAIVEELREPSAFFKQVPAVPGLWVPIGISGLPLHTLLDFSDAANLGRDASGNGNGWTLTDAVQSLDTPTNNFCTLNPLDNGTTGLLSGGNLTASGDAKVTLRPASGKWYYERNGEGVSYDADANGRFDPVLTAGTYNFGAAAWEGAGPVDDEKPLCDASLPEPAVLDTGKYLATVLRTGTGAETSIALGFRPDAVFIKARSTATHHAVFDSGRGAARYVTPDVAAVETADEQSLMSFNVDGYNLGSSAVVNAEGVEFRDIAIKASPKIGFDVVKWDGDGTTARFIPYDLGGRPASVIMMKCPQTNGGWSVYHKDLSLGKFVCLDTNNRVSSMANRFYAVSADGFVPENTPAYFNKAGESYVAYCFADSDVFSAFFWIGNGGANGPYGYTGGKPENVFFGKNVNYTERSWIEFNAIQNPASELSTYLRWDGPNAEATMSNVTLWTTSNGLRANGTSIALNGSGHQVIYLVFTTQHKYRNAL
jgi:hypothetical protein